MENNYKEILENILDFLQIDGTISNIKWTNNPLFETIAFETDKITYKFVKYFYNKIKVYRYEKTNED